MILEFTNTPQDFICAHKYIDSHKKSNHFCENKDMNIFIILFFIICNFLVINIFSMSFTIKFIIFSIIQCIFIIFINPKLLVKKRYRAIQNWKSNKPELEQKKIDIKDQILICISQSISMELSLVLIKRIVEENDLIYIFGSNYNLFLVIPVSAFSSIEEKKLFLSKLNNYETKN